MKVIYEKMEIVEVKLEDRRAKRHFGIRVHMYCTGCKTFIPETKCALVRHRKWILL